MQGDPFFNARFLKLYEQEPQRLGFSPYTYYVRPAGMVVDVAEKEYPKGKKLPSKPRVNGSISSVNPASLVRS